MEMKPAVITDGEFPQEVCEYTAGAGIYDSSCSEDARVFFIDRDGGLFLKVAVPGTLETEAIMTRYFHSRGLSAPVLLYLSGKQDYLITARIPGEDGTSAACLADPPRLCEVFADTLLRLHRTDFSGCPLNSKTSSFIDCSPYSCLIHGDYCLPNIIMENFRFTGFVDLDHAGIGDPHRDISSALWTLNYNLKTDKYNNMFLDFYGRDKIDFERLELWAAE